jgi:hypothetical protein
MPMWFLLALNIVLAIVVIAWLHNPPFGYGLPAGLEGWQLSDKIAVIASISALLQFFALVVTWSLMKDTARRQLRAYVSGGLGKYSDMPVGWRLYVTINNYGTTPAFIGTVSATLIAESELPATPREDDPGEFMGYVLPPVHDMEKSYASKCSVWWQGKPGECVYGRIYYRDIFDKCRSVGFLLRIIAANKNEAIASEVYWKERDEADLGPAARARSEITP